MIPCPFCNTQIDPAAFFCPNCGKKVREKPISTGLGSQILLYLLSLFLPPLNLILTIRYLKSPDSKAKKIGFASLGLMTVGIILAVWLAAGVTKSVNQQVNQQLKMYQNIGL